jgi:ABC-type nitrate/sulfonate/bicarbonate transport system substrate-binding protein
VIADRQAVDLITSWVQDHPEEWQQLIARCAL